MSHCRSTLVVQVHLFQEMLSQLAHHIWHISNVTYTIVNFCNYVILMQTSPPMQYCFAPEIYLHPFARENSKTNRTNKTIQAKANVHNHYAMIYQNLVSVILKLKTS